jgi:hypothetical protein
MASIESSFGVVYGKGPHGWDSQEVAVCKLAARVLNAYESYFWVSVIFNHLPIQPFRSNSPFRNAFEALDSLMALPSVSMKSTGWRALGFIEAQMPSRLLKLRVQSFKV